MSEVPEDAGNTRGNLSLTHVPPDEAANSLSLRNHKNDSSEYQPRHQENHRNHWPSSHIGSQRH